jgi:hypothetical protein
MAKMIAGIFEVRAKTRFWGTIVASTVLGYQELK